MKRKITACLAAVMLLLSVAGCRQGDFDNASSKGNADAAPNSKQTSSYTAKQQSDIDFIIDSDRYFVGFDEYGDAIGANGIVEDGIYKSKKAGIVIDANKWKPADKDRFYDWSNYNTYCDFISVGDTDDEYLAVAFQTLYNEPKRDDDNWQEARLMLELFVKEIKDSYIASGTHRISETQYEGNIAGRPCVSTLIIYEDTGVEISVNYYIVQNSDYYRNGVLVVAASHSASGVQDAVSSVLPLK